MRACVCLPVCVSVSLTLDACLCVSGAVWPRIWKPKVCAKGDLDVGRCGAGGSGRGHTLSTVCAWCVRVCVSVYVVVDEH